MDKATKAGKFIRLQFFALWMMILLTLWMAAYAHGANNLQAFWKKEIDFLLPELGRLEKQHDDDQRVIADLDARLKQYEFRFGEIQPVRKGEGMYIGRILPDGTRPFFYLAK